MRERSNWPRSYPGGEGNSAAGSVVHWPIGPWSRRSGGAVSRSSSITPSNGSSARRSARRGVNAKPRLGPCGVSAEAIHRSLMHVTRTSTQNRWQDRRCVCIRQLPERRRVACRVASTPTYRSARSSRMPISRTASRSTTSSSGHTYIRSPRARRLGEYRTGVVKMHHRTAKCAYGRIATHLGRSGGMADAAGLNPAVPQGAWGFESLLRHLDRQPWDR
jgi:hypothetical protein